MELTIKTSYFKNPRTNRLNKKYYIELDGELLANKPLAEKLNINVYDCIKILKDADVQWEIIYQGGTFFSLKGLKNAQRVVDKLNSLIIMNKLVE